MKKKGMSAHTRGHIAEQRWKVEWLREVLRGHARAMFTGQLVITVNFCKGSVRTLRVVEVNSKEAK
jgi:hypothetical protein